MNLIHTAAWRKLKKILDADKDDLLQQLVNCKSHDESNLIRGRIIQITDTLEQLPLQVGDVDDD
jgi:hypothetical protein